MYVSRKTYDHFTNSTEPEQNEQPSSQPTKRELLIKLSDAMFKIFDKKFNFGRLQKKKVNPKQSLNTITDEPSKDIASKAYLTTMVKPSFTGTAESNDSPTPPKEMCCICLDKYADAVVFPCCHGRICFLCGKELISKGVCHLCRNVMSLLGNS